jgi:ABC-2 type transport system permease protein
MKILTIFNKEWLLLWRDKVGLIFLFLLPMCLVLFITLTSSSDSEKPRQLQLLLINQDANGTISQGIVKGLNKVENFVISQSLHHQPLTIDSAKKAVDAGHYQAVITIPAQLSQQIMNKMQQILQPQLLHTVVKPTNVQVLFDPALPKTLQDQVTGGVQLIAQAIELQLWQQIVQKQTSSSFNTTQSGMIGVDTQSIENEGSSVAPNDVQQNVPAWALFGMFFIITPLSCMTVKERRLGVMQRLSLAPVSLFTLIWGKIGAFVCVNLLQLALMLAVGVVVLPWFDLPMLNVNHHFSAIFCVGLAASLAATGFGMLIGSLVKTSEQANVIGPFLIVILAAIGGIFVPVYLLPEELKHIAQYSPMYWALQSFLDIFIRNAGVMQLWANMAKLLGFAVVTISLASFILSRFRYSS